MFFHAVEVSLLAFGKQDTTCDEFKKRKREDMEAEADVRIEQSKEKSARVPNKIPTTTIVDTCANDILHAVANFIAFSQVFVPIVWKHDTKNPTIINMMFELANLVSNPLTQAFLERTKTEKVFVFHSIFLYFNDLLAHFSYVIRATRAIDVYQDNEEIKGSWYQNTCNHFANAHRDIQNLANAVGYNGNFLSEPMSYTIFGSGKKTDSNPSNGNKNVNQGKGKKPVSGSDNSTKGWLSLKENVDRTESKTFTFPPGVRKFCLYFAFLGFECRHKNCNYPHLVFPRDFKETEKNALSEYLKDHEKFQLANFDIKPVTNSNQTPIKTNEIAHPKTFGEHLRKAAKIQNNGKITNISNQYSPKYPSTAELIKTTKFGKPNARYSFTREASFDDILIILIKSGMLDVEGSDILFEVHPLYRQLFKLYTTTKNLDFSGLKTGENDSIKLRTAMAFHYDLHLPSMIRYLNGHYLKQKLDVDHIIDTLQKIKCPTMILQDIQRVLTDGAPYRLNYHSSRENFLEFYNYGNHPTISQNDDAVMKAISKEEKYKYAFTLPGTLTRFIPNIHVTPQSILQKKGKKDRLIFDGSFQPTPFSRPVNAMHNNKEEPELVFGSAFQRHIKQVYNKRITYPTETLYQFADDVTAAFRQPKYHPDIVGAFCSRMSNVLLISVGQTFGSITSPQNYEPLARARAFLAQHLSHDGSIHLVKKYKSYLDKVQWDQRKDLNHIPRAIPKKDKLNPGVLDINNNVKNTEHNPFVDDTLIVEILPKMKIAMAASLDSCFTIFGDSESTIRCSISEEKYESMVCSPINSLLGLEIDTHRLTVAITKEKIHVMNQKVKAFHKSRKRFLIKEGVELLGTLEFAACYSPWFRHLFISLRQSINVSLSQAQNAVKNSEYFVKMVHQMSLFAEHDIDRKNQYLRYVDKALAKKAYSSKVNVNITRAMRNDFDIIHEITTEENFHLWRTPIAHLIERVPDFTSFGDSCLEGAGGFSTELNFWWYMSWPEEVKKISKQALIIKCDKEQNISINLREFAAIIINYAAATEALKENPRLCDHSHPTLLNWADNRSADSWTRKSAASSNLIGKGLAQIMCGLQLGNRLGLHSNYIPGSDNIISDRISRFSSSLPIDLQFFQLKQKFTAIKHCKRFHLSREFYSCLIGTLLSQQGPTFQSTKEFGHF